VTALVRPDTAFQPPPGVTVQRGSALEPSVLAKAAGDREAVISCIGPQRINPRNPWSPLRQPLRVAELSARALVTALQGGGSPRVAAISAAGVGDGIEVTNAVIRWLVRTSTIGAMYADLDAMEHVLRGSRFDWLAVRPVTLINAAPSSRTKIVSRFRVYSVVGRADVAAWLLRSVSNPAPLVDRTPMIGWW
jgi:hypothetical protein